MSKISLVDNSQHLKASDRFVEQHSFPSTQLMQELPQYRVDYGQIRRAVCQSCSISNLISYRERELQSYFHDPGGPIASQVFSCSTMLCAQYSRKVEIMKISHIMTLGGMSHPTSNIFLKELQKICLFVSLQLCKLCFFLYTF